MSAPAATVAAPKVPMRKPDGGGGESGEKKMMPLCANSHMWSGVSLGELVDARDQCVLALCACRKGLLLLVQ